MSSKLQNKKLLESWFGQQSLYSKSFVENESRLKNLAQQDALKVFKLALKRIHAYGDFLERYNVSPSSIKTFKDFGRIPVMTKKNYINKYSIDKRVQNGDMLANHMVSISSGTTRSPNFWPRDLRTEIEGAIQHEYIFKQILNLGNKKTLFINGFALGNWIAGTFTSACVNLVSQKGMPITLMSPGYSSESIIEVLSKFARHFNKVIITGHTPFIKEVAETARQKGIGWSKLDVTLLGTGQGITENWREYIIGILEAKDYYRTFINLYGSADAALMGFETPLTIYLRKILSIKSGLREKIFGDTRLPSLYQFNPRLTYFEQHNGELLITKYSGCPLVRYNIHDTGGVFEFSQLLKLGGSDFSMGEIKKETGFNFAKFPFVYLYGREKFMVKIYGANIYTEHVQSALNYKKLQPYLTGRFILEIEEDRRLNPKLVCRIELTRDYKKDKKQLAMKVKKIFIDEVSQLSDEYNDVLKNVGSKAQPNIRIYDYGNAKYFPENNIKKTA